MAGINGEEKRHWEERIGCCHPGGWGLGSKKSSLPIAETWDSRIFHMQKEWGPQGSDLVMVKQQVITKLG